MKLNIIVDKQSSVPYYHQVKETVKNLIASGEMKPGDLLPSEFSLSDQLSISRLVVHRAYRELVAEGFLVRKRAKGTYVAPHIKHAFTVTGPLFSMTEDLSIDALEPSNKVLLQEVVEASEEIRSGLKLPEGAGVVHIVNLRLAKQLPFAIEEMYFSYERFPALADMDLNNRSVYSTLEKLYDAHPQEALDVIFADSASSQEARLLGMDRGVPVMRVNRTSTDRSGKLVEYSKIVFHASRYQLVAHMQRIG
jgi:GntR family transcriptional regulator, N-acetylglucosamine utilization regulator